MTVDDQRPMVHIDDQALQADAADDCEESGLAGVLICQSLSVAVPSQAFAPGRYGVMVTNTAPAGCSTSEPVLVSFAPAPQVSGVVPEIVCTEDGTVNLTVSGEDFLRVGAALPSIVIGSAEYPAVSATCEATPFLDDGDNVVHRCTELEVAITETALVPDVYQVAVKNPAPYDCIGLEQTSPILVTGAPVVDETEPDVICRGQFDDGRMTLVGRGFLTIDGAHPEVLVNQVAGEDIVVPEDYCDALEGLNYTILGCRRLEFTVPQALRDGDLDISLSNPAPAQCMAAEYQFTMNETPHIDDVQPEKVCYLGGDLRLWGEFFEEGMAVDLDGTAARTVLLSNNGTQALATFGEVEAGLRTLTATNPSGCAESYDTNIRVTNGPVPFFVDPAVAYNQLSLQITVYLGNLYGGSVEEVIITDSQGTSTPLGGLSFDPQRPTQVQALLPAGLPADTYSVTLVDEVDCPGTGENLLVITDQAEVMVTGIQPPFGWTESSTGVTISSDPQAPAEQQFAATPRVYINPSEAAQGVTARELRASTFVSSVELNGIVASGFEPGLYDIIVLNPDGGVGVLEAGFRVTQEPPPLIGSVSPGSWSNKDNITLTISGQFFRDNLDVVVECRNSASPAVNITGVTAETVTATVNTGGLAHLDVCAIRVINDDTSYDEFSPITVTNPASNFISLRSATDLDHPRRKPAVSSGVPSRGQRFVYVIGGDDGQESNAFASGRFCVTDRFGTPQQWQALPYDLPAGRTLSRAFRIGDFVYVAGGYAVVEAGVDEGASADVLRAHVVDPLHVVEINDVNLQIEDGVGGLEEGVYYYRVAVVLDEDDDANPLGETLASDPQPIRIPDIQEGVHVNIGWDAFPNAQRYRIYRSEAADVPYGNEMLIAEVATDSFTDNGSLAVDPSLRPMTLGSLGRWHKVAELNEARFNHGLAVAADPVTEDRHIIFMVGGENDVAAMASIEHLVVDVDGPQQQQVSPVGIPNLVSLAAPTTRLEAVVANRNNASLFPDDRNFLIAYGGMDSGGVTGRVLATEVSADGLLDPFTSLTTMSQTHSGFVGLVANNFIIALYGNNGQPNNGAHRAILCGEGCAFPPTINVGNSSWKSMGNVAGRDRHLPGHTLLRGFLYVAGGLTSGSVPTATVDFSPIGSP